MRKLIQRSIYAGMVCSLALPLLTQAQSDAATIYKTNCDLCHGPGGSGDTPTGKAFHAKDLRSDDVQKQSDATLTEVITKGRGKMPAFGGKIRPADVQKLVSYIRSLPKT